MSEQRNDFPINIPKPTQLILIILATLILQANGSAQVKTSDSPPQTLAYELETECFNMVQGKVAYDRAGSKTWDPANIRRLCANTAGPDQTIACFQKVIKESDSWTMGIELCSRSADRNKTPAAPKMPVPTASPARLGPTGLETPPTGVQFLPDNQSDTAGPMEKACHNELQGKVATSMGGGKVWSAQAYRALCKGTTASPAPAVACFKQRLAASTPPQQALVACAAIPPPPGRLIDFNVYDTDTGKEGLTPDELDPVEIFVNPPPVSEADMEKVMQWIGVRTAALITPYCYKRSYSLGGASTLGCPAGKEKNGQLCYDNCRAGYTGNGPACYQNCPSGYNLKDIGALCQKPASYGRGAGYALWDKGKCEKDNPQGCDQNGVMFYPKCKDGFEAVGCCVCSPKCPPGMTNTGTDCVKNSYTRGAGTPIGGCPAGQQQIGLLCYAQCKPGYAATGPTCYQKCPVQQSVDCAAGCAVKTEDCVITTASQIIAPILAVYSIATLGSGAGETAIGKYASTTIRGASAAIREGSWVGLKMTRLRQIFNSIKRGIDAAMGPADNPSFLKTTKAGVVAAFAGQDKFDSFVKNVTTLNRIRVVVSGTARLITVYSREYANNFENMTSPEISQEIDKNFGPVGAMEVKKRWAMYTLQLLGKSSGEATGEVIGSIIGAFDPTGITGIISAFAHPVCGDDTPFPKVTLINKD